MTNSKLTQRWLIMGAEIAQHHRRIQLNTTSEALASFQELKPLDVKVIRYYSQHKPREHLPTKHTAAALGC